MDAEDGVVAVQSAFRGRRERAALHEATAAPVRSLSQSLNRNTQRRNHELDAQQPGPSALRGIPPHLAEALGPKALRRLHDMPPGQAAMVAASVARSTAKARASAAAKQKQRRSGHRGHADGIGRGSPLMDVADEVTRLRAKTDKLQSALQGVQSKNHAMAKELAALSGAPVVGAQGGAEEAYTPHVTQLGGGAWELEGGIQEAPTYAGVHDTSWLEMRCMQLSSRIAVLEQERSSGAWRPSGEALRQASRAAGHTIAALQKHAAGLLAAAESGKVPSETQLLRRIRATRLSVGSLADTNDELKALLEGGAAPPAAAATQHTRQQLAADMAAVQAAMHDTRQQLQAATAAATREQAAVAALVRRRGVLRGMLAEAGVP